MWNLSTESACHHKEREEYNIVRGYRKNEKKEIINNAIVKCRTNILTLAHNHKKNWIKNNQELILDKHYYIENLH